jgi:serine/threonine protein kinase
VALKVEKPNKVGSLLEEQQILITLQSCKYVPRLIACGKHLSKMNYIAMELLGENISNLRRKQSSHTFSLLTTVMLARQMLRCIREVHACGILHRDIKPPNFVIGTAERCNPRSVYMIDYGLSREHLDPATGEPKPKRGQARWVGSRRYMSLNTHMRREQGRRDDLWSLLYVIIELRTGTLPWAHLRGVENLDRIRDIKLQYNNEKLVRGLPLEFLKFVTYVKTLRYESLPDYDFLDGLMLSLLHKNNGNEATPYDWETEEEARANIELERSNQSSAMPMTSSGHKSGGDGGGGSLASSQSGGASGLGGSGHHAASHHRHSGANGGGGESVSPDEKRDEGCTLY